MHPNIFLLIQLLKQTE